MEVYILLSAILVTDCLYVHDEYYGAIAELGLNKWTHCTGVHFKQVEALAHSCPVLQHDIQRALGVRWRETKVNTRPQNIITGERVHDYMSHRGNIMSGIVGDYVIPRAMHREGYKPYLQYKLLNLVYTCNFYVFHNIKS